MGQPLSQKPVFKKYGPPPQVDFIFLFMIQKRRLYILKHILKSSCRTIIYSGLSLSIIQDKLNLKITLTNETKNAWIHAPKRYNCFGGD